MIFYYMLSFIFLLASSWPFDIPMRTLPTVVRSAAAHHLPGWQAQTSSQLEQHTCKNAVFQLSCVVEPRHDTQERVKIQDIFRRLQPPALTNEGRSSSRRCLVLAQLFALGRHRAPRRTNKRHLLPSISDRNNFAHPLLIFRFQD